MILNVVHRRRFSSSPHLLRRPPTIPIPHRSIADPRGVDQDFVAVAVSHVIHGELDQLSRLRPGLTSFRATHILLALLNDHVLSSSFHRWSLAHSPGSLTLLSHAVALHSLARSGRFKLAGELLGSVIIPATPAHQVFDELLHSYNLCGSSPAAFDALFKAYAHAGKLRDATDTFLRMRDHGLLPNVKSCNAFLSSLLRLRRPDIATSFFREMGRCRISPNVYTLNMAMRAMCGTGRTGKALDLLATMEGMGISPTVSTFNTLIAAHCKGRLMDAAVRLKDSIGEKGMEPNEITYNSLIHGFCLEGRMHDANKALREMKAAGVSPNTVTYNTLIGGYGGEKNSDMAFVVYEEMRMRGVEANMVTYNALIMGLCMEGKTRRAASLVKELEGKNLVPNESTYFALIAGQCERGNSERAFQIFKAMKRSKCRPNADTFRMLISAFHMNKDFDGVVEVVREMREGWIGIDKKMLADIADELREAGKDQLAKELQPEVC